MKFDRVADRGSGGVAFDQRDVSRIPARLRVGGAKGAKLALGARGEQTAVDVVRQSHGGDDPVNLVSLADGVGEPLEKEHPGPFADDEAVGLGVEWASPAGGRQGPKLGETHLRVLRIGAREAPGQDRVEPAGKKLVGGEFEGVQRRGTGGVERIGTPAQPEGRRHESRGQARREPVQGVGRRGLPRRVGMAENALLEGSPKRLSRDRRGGYGRQHDIAEDDPDARSVESLGPGVSPRGAGGVQSKVEHRIKPIDGDPRQIEPLGVEHEILDESASGGIAMIRGSGSRVEGVRGIDRPAAGGDLRRGVDRAGDQAPERVRVGRAGEDPAETDDCHAFRSWLG